MQHPVPNTMHYSNPRCREQDVIDSRGTKSHFIYLLTHAHRAPLFSHYVTRNVSVYIRDVLEPRTNMQSRNAPIRSAGLLETFSMSSLEQEHFLTYLPKPISEDIDTTCSFPKMILRPLRSIEIRQPSHKMVRSLFLEQRPQIISNVDIKPD